MIIYDDYVCADKPDACYLPFRQVSSLNIAKPEQTPTMGVQLARRRGAPVCLFTPEGREWDTRHDLNAAVSRWNDAIDEARSVDPQIELALWNIPRYGPGADLLDDDAAAAEWADHAVRVLTLLHGPATLVLNGYPRGDELSQPARWHEVVGRLVRIVRDGIHAAVRPDFDLALMVSPYGHPKGQWPGELIPPEFWGLMRRSCRLWGVSPMLYDLGSDPWDWSAPWLRALLDEMT